MDDPGVDEKTPLTIPEPYSDVSVGVGEKPGTPDQQRDTGTNVGELENAQLELANGSAGASPTGVSSPQPGSEVLEIPDTGESPPGAGESPPPAIGNPEPPSESEKDVPGFESQQPTQEIANQQPPPSPQDTITYHPTQQQPKSTENQPTVDPTPAATNPPPDLDPRNHQVLDRPLVFASPSPFPQGGPPPSQEYSQPQGTVSQPAASEQQQQYLQQPQQQGAPVYGQYGQQYAPQPQQQQQQQYDQQQQYYQQQQQYYQQQAPPDHQPGSQASQRTVKVRSPGEYQPLISTCPQCHSGTFSEQFSVVGILLGIFCFPCGLICCFLMREKRCSNCGLVI